MVDFVHFLSGSPGLDSSVLIGSGCDLVGIDQSPGCILYTHR